MLRLYPPGVSGQGHTVPDASGLVATSVALDLVNLGEIRLHFVNSPNELGKGKWTECWFSAQSFIDVLHRLLYVRPHDSLRRDEAVRSFIQRLGRESFLP